MKRNKTKQKKNIKLQNECASIDYEREYHRLIAAFATAHNEREEAKGAVIFMSKIIAEKDKKIAEIEKELEDRYWRVYGKR